MATYTIEPERHTLHGHFSRELTPVLAIDPGDTVNYRTLDAGWGLEPLLSFDSPRREFEPRDEELDTGHALCGPIEIRGAQPGMTLEVQINDIRPGAFGLTVADDLAIYKGLGIDRRALLTWTLDADTMTGYDQYGHTLTLRPFMGVMGMPPDEAGALSTSPPRFCGGNLDCKELVAGSTLYLPIAVPGGLFSVGDGHALQGDGEVCGTAIECPMERVSLTFRLRNDLRLTMPRANTPAGWLTMGLHKDLNQAMDMAMIGMLDLMEELYHLPRPEALALASLVVDLRITQVVNGVRGVHALLPHGTLR
ncbi:MAG TPA: acetamidase/formamidase family protein [Ktedonobacteraceae bacterium]|nr:acetamidase/formamidase family protein [Ktedonobacteraceae bacterium]